MPEQVLAYIGNDPSIPADILAPSTDPAAMVTPVDPGYIDPLMNVSALNSSTVVVGPGSAVNIQDPTSPTVSTSSGTSILDGILKIGALGAAFANAYAFRTGITSNPTVTAQKQAQASQKAGTSNYLLIFAALLFAGFVYVLASARK